MSNFDFGIANMYFDFKKFVEWPYDCIWYDSFFKINANIHIGDEKAPKRKQRSYEKFIDDFYYIAKNNNNVFSEIIYFEEYFIEYKVLYYLYHYDDENSKNINDNSEKYVFCFESSGDSKLQMLGIIDNKTNNYLIIGTDNYHPFYHNNKISYFNSDGSGPDMDIEKVYLSPKKIIKQIKYYFPLFADNDFH